MSDQDEKEGEGEEKDPYPNLSEEVKELIIDDFDTLDKHREG